MEGDGLRLRSTSGSGYASNLNREGINEECTAVPIRDEGECHELLNDHLMSSQFFGICEEGGIDRGIDFLHEEGRLYDVLLSKNEDQDTPLHVAIKRNNVNLTKEILRILGKPYELDSSYEDKYFKHKKPLSKVINTQNKEGKDVITLVIEGDNQECTSAVFGCLACEDINRKKDVESGYTPLHEAVLSGKSNAIRELLKSEYVDVELLDESSHEACDYIRDEEIIRLLIRYCDNEVHKFRRLADSNKGPTLTEYYLNIVQLSCAGLQCFAFPVAFGAVVLDTQSDSMPHSGFTMNHISHIVTSFAVLASCVGLLSGRKLSECKEERLKGEKKFNSWRERRGKLEDKLFYVMREKGQDIEIEELKEKDQNREREIEGLRKMIANLSLQGASTSQQNAQATTNGQPSSELSISKMPQQLSESEKMV